MLKNKLVSRAVAGALTVFACWLLVGCNGSKSSNAASPTLFVTDGVSNRVVQITDVNNAVWTPLGTLGSGTARSSSDNAFVSSNVLIGGACSPCV